MLGGGFSVDRKASEAALAKLGYRSVEEAAKGVIDVSNALMARAVRYVSVERGHDPAEFTLFAFGGAGPLHACELAEALSIPRVLVPPYPGLMSAAGMAHAETTRDFAAPLLVTHRPDGPASVSLSSLQAGIETLSGQAEAELGAGTANAVSVDMRYEGQGHELNVPWDGGSAGELLEAFHALHQRTYGHHSRERSVELVTLRLRARVPRPEEPTATVEPGPADATPARTGKRRVRLAREEDVPLYRRDRLYARDVIHGPAIVEQVDSTTLVQGGWTATVHDSGALILTRS